MGPLSEPVSSVRELNRSDSGAKGDVSGEMEDGQGKRSVLVSVPELVQDPKLITRKGIPSEMRLEPLDRLSVWVDCPMRLAISDSLQQVQTRIRSVSGDRFGEGSAM